MLKVTATIFGVYSHGEKEGHVNPKETVTFTGIGESVRKAMSGLCPRDDEGNIVWDDMPIYKVQEVVELSA